MGTTSTARRTAVGLLLALLLGLLSGVGTSTVLAPSAHAAEKGRVVGEVLVPGNVKLKVRWFDKNWNFLGSRKVNGTIYSLRLAPGTYYLQFTDERPAYNVDKYAPTDVRVRVRSGKKVQKNVRMKPGAAITGAVRAGGKALGGAKVVAANANEQSFSTKANDKGQFAIGGLPDGSYSVFTYDRKKTWVDKSTYVQGLRSKQKRNIGIVLRKKAGQLLVDLRAGGQRVKETVFVTAISKASGQFWTVKAKRGEASFKGLYPGKYRMVAPGVGNYLPQDGAIKGANVKAGRADLASTFTWKKRGASISGFVLDEVYPDTVLKDVQVLAFAKDGRLLGSTSTSGDGSFTLGGPITTQGGITLKIQPGGSNPPYLTGAYYCKFGASSLSPLSVTQGEDLQVGDLLLPQLATSEQDNKSNCGPDHTAP